MQENAAGRNIGYRGGSLRQESHRLSANVRAFLLGPKIREGGGRKRRDERKLGQARSAARQRENARRKLVAREREKGRKSEAMIARAFEDE